MDPNALKAAWQNQPKPMIATEQLLAEVQRDQRQLARTILWRDVREVAVCLVMIPVWVYLGWAQSLPWTWYLTLPALLWVAGFMIVDRLRHSQRSPDAGEPLVQCVVKSLSQTEHQIWLLRNVAWWYLLPIGAAILAFVGQSAWRTASGLEAAVLTAAAGAIVGLVFYGLYRLNQIVVRDRLEPHRRELATLLDQLQGDSDRS